MNFRLLEKWLGSGDEEVVQEYIRTSVQAGKLGVDRARCAAAMGGQISWAEWVESAAESDHYPDVLESVLLLLHEDERMQFLIGSLEHVSASWGAYSVDDRPVVAFQTLCRWKESTTDVMKALGDAAAAAEFALDYPELTKEVDPPRVRAGFFASAVADGCLAVEELLDGYPEDALQSVASAANLATKAAEHKGEEKAWQLRLLRKILLFVPMP